MRRKKELNTSVEDLCAELEIAISRYNEEFAALQALGYGKDLANKIILRRSSKNTVKTVIKLHDELIKNFNYEEITKIAAQSGGSKNLDAVHNNLAALLKLEFTKEDIIKMVAHRGGSKNLDAVQRNLAALLKLEFTKEDIIKMVAHIGGSKNLDAIIECSVLLEQSDLSRQDIAKCFRHGKEGREVLKSALAPYSSSLSEGAQDFLCNDEDALLLDSTNNAAVVFMTRRKDPPFLPQAKGGLAALQKDQVFASFKFNRDKKGGCFTLNKNYLASKVIGNLRDNFFNSHAITVTRYFSKISLDGSSISLSINHTDLQQAKPDVVKAALAFIILTRFYVYKDSLEVLLGKSEANPLSSDKANICFSTLAQAWKKDFPLLEEAFIMDVLNSWFIAAIQKWHDEFSATGEVNLIKPKWLVHRGEFVLVKHYTLFKDNIGDALASWKEPPLQEEESIPDLNSFSYQLLFSGLPSIQEEVSAPVAQKNQASITHRPRPGVEIQRTAHQKKPAHHWVKLSDFGHNRVFSRFTFASNHNAGYFILNKGYVSSDVKKSLSSLFDRYSTILHRYFVIPEKKSAQVGVLINHPDLQQASSDIKAAFSLLIRARCFIREDNHYGQELLEQSQISELSVNEAQVTFSEELIDSWHALYPSLNKSFIQDVFGSWFIAAMHARQQELGEDVPKEHPDFLQNSFEFRKVKGEFFLYVKNYALFKDKHEALEHWARAEEPLATLNRPTQPITIAFDESNHPINNPNPLDAWIDSLFQPELDAGIINAPNTAFNDLGGHNTSQNTISSSSNLSVFRAITGQIVKPHNLRDKQKKPLLKKTNQTSQICALSFFSKQKVDIAVFMDFDGTVTRKAGGDTVFSPFYQCLLVNETNERIQQNYKKPAMKDKDIVVRLFEDKFGTFNNTFNYNQDGADILIQAESVNFLHELVKCNEVSIHIVTKNRSDYIKLLLIYQGFSQKEIAKITILDSGKKYNDVANHLKEIKKGGQGPKQVYIMDDDPVDCEQMTAAAKDNGCQLVKSYNKKTGQFDWSDYLMEIKLSLEKITTLLEERLINC